jgi:hypothetical protein
MSKPKPKPKSAPSPKPAPKVYGVHGIPEALRDVIERQRDNIGNALSLLQCLSHAIHETEWQDPLQRPFFPAAIQGIVEMLARTTDAFDPGNIEKRLRLTGREALIASAGANVLENPLE